MSVSPESRFGPNEIVASIGLHAVYDRRGKPQPVTCLEKAEAAQADPVFLADGRLVFDVVMETSGGRKDNEGIYVQTPGVTVGASVIATEQSTR